MSETQLSKAIRDALTVAGFHVERVNAGRVKVRGGYFQGASAGTPDTVVCWPAYGWLETKTPEGELNEAQLEWHAKAKRYGVRVETVRTVAGALTAAGKWRRQDDLIRVERRRA